ncbi:MAG: DUF4870 domain-containing protein [Chlorobi bacterium]|nr:DUF4870 domain-containing protein [Chlorobiota bacterium]
MEKQPVKNFPSREERNYAALIHLSQIVGSWIGGIGSLVLPLIMWLLKRDESKFIDETGKEVVNFQLSLYIYLIILWLLTLPTLGLIWLAALPFILAGELIIIIFAVIGAVKAANGEIYRYPLNLRLIK